MGKELLLTDTLSSSMAWTGELQWSGTNVMPSYDKDKHHITWQDTLNVGESASITYTVTIATDQRKSLINTVQIQEEDQETKTSSVTLIANPSRVHLPIVLHNK
jgi:alkyl hydroperoxide reductase subunit AhpC